MRYSTLLMYLNDPEEGGETTFPRWSNAETFKELAVKPEIGKAVLFYSQVCVNELIKMFVRLRHL